MDTKNELKTMTEDQNNLKVIEHLKYLMEANVESKLIKQFLSTVFESNLSGVKGKQHPEFFPISNSDSSLQKTDRYLVDGVFDTTHLGHFNAIRQSKEISKHLTVGLSSDEEVALLKAQPVLTNHERAQLISNLKWVDTVLEDLPYTVDLQILDSLNIQYAVHGDDTCLDSNGNDV